MKRLLLDTHIWLWYLAASDSLPQTLRESIDDSLGLIWLSPISVWEAGVLAKKRRIRLSTSFEKWVVEAMEHLPVREAPINIEIARRIDTLDLPHGDPADHFLAATALVHDLTLVTVDRHLASAPWLSIQTA